MKLVCATAGLVCLMISPAHALWRIEDLAGGLPSETYFKMVGTGEMSGSITVGCKLGGDLILSYQIPGEGVSVGEPVDLIVLAGVKDTYTFAATVSSVEAGKATIDFHAKAPLIEFLKDIRDSLDYVTAGYRSASDGIATQTVVSARGSTKAANALLDHCDL